MLELLVRQFARLSRHLVPENPTADQDFCVLESSVRMKSAEPQNLTNTFELTCDKCNATVAVSKGMFITFGSRHFVCSFSGARCKSKRAAKSSSVRASAKAAAACLLPIADIEGGSR